MNSSKRLTEGAGTDFERLLLASAADDRAPLTARNYVAAALGIAPARASLAARPRQAASRGDAAPLAPATAREASLAALVKYTLIALVGGLSTVSSVSEAETVSAAPSVTIPPLPESSPIDDSSAVPAAPVAASPAAPLAVRRLTPNLGRSGAARVEPLRAPRPIERATDPLLLEVRRLDRVRSALGSGRALEALGELDAYDAQFPRGALALEATVLRVRTLQRAGRFALAARLARRALSLPNSERYRDELERVGAVEAKSTDKLGGAATLVEAR